MADGGKLIPVFIPSLGSLLINAEDKKASPLDENEVIQVRNKATVMMMKPADAQKLNERRGYSDVDPENCWHDWQNLRDRLGRKPTLPAGPRFTQIGRADAEFNRTIEHARMTLSVFRKYVASEKNGAVHMLKTQLTEDDKKSYMWLNDARECEGGFMGNLFEVPRNFTRHHVGQEIFVPSDSVMDWMVNDHGCVHGGFSIRLMRQRKPETEQRQFDQYMGVTSYAPLPDML